MTAHRWGIYEKALAADAPWSCRLEDAFRAGYQFIEMSIDESDERLARLDWPRGQRQELHRALAEAPASIDTMCLSGHRRFPLGSASAGPRQQALDLMKKAIDFAAEFGIRVIQVAGYDVFYEPSTEQTRGLYMESLLRSAEWARGACVMLGLENVDCPTVDSVEAGMGYIRAAHTPWLQMYPDVGNLAAACKDVTRELRAGGAHIIGVHLKDTRVGEFRRVPYGQGIVDFPAAFRVLSEIGFAGPFVIEMWNEDSADPVAVASEARRWLAGKLEQVAV